MTWRMLARLALAAALLWLLVVLGPLLLAFAVIAQGKSKAVPLSLLALAALGIGWAIRGVRPRGRLRQG